MISFAVRLKQRDHNNTLYTGKIELDELFIFNNLLIRLNNICKNLNPINLNSIFMMLFILENLRFRYYLNDIKVRVD